MQRVPNKPIKPLKQERSLGFKAKFFMFQLITAALLLGGIGWWGYTQVMKMALGRFTLFSGKQDIAGDYNEPRILLLSPLRTERFLKPDSLAELDWPWLKRSDDWPYADTLWYSAQMEQPKEKDIVWQDLTQTGAYEVHIVDYWEDLLFRSELAFTTITETNLIRIDDTYNILIIPGALLLSDREKDGIKKFVSEGGNVLACWSPGCRDENGDWKGFRFMEQMFGGLVSDPVADPSGGTSLILKNDSPITAMIPSGTHLDLFTYNGFVTMDIIEPRSKCDGFWFKPYWKNHGADSGTDKAMIVRGNYLRGKFVWFSFTPDPIQPQKNNFTIASKLILNAIDWLHGKAIVRAKIWPEGFSAGGSLLLETQTAESELLNIISVARQSNVWLDLIVEEGYAPKRALAENNYQGGIVLKFNDPEKLFKESLSEQNNILATEVDKIYRLSGITPTGLFPGNWSYNENAVQSAAQNGFKYILGSSTPRFYGPSVEEIKPGVWYRFAKRIPVGIMPKAQLSTKEWVLGGVRGKTNIHRAMYSDMTRIAATGGIYLGILDPYTLVKENSVDLVQQLSADMDSLNIWRVPAETLMERFCGWEGIRVASEDVTQARVTIRYSNEGKYTLQNLTFEVYLTGEIESVALKSQIVGSKPINVGWNRQRGVATFTIPEINPGDNGGITIDKVFAESLEL